MILKQEWTFKKIKLCFEFSENLVLLIYSMWKNFLLRTKNNPVY